MAKQPPVKRRKRSLLKKGEYDLIAQAWTHYKSYIGASDDGYVEEIEEQELEEEEDGDIDEIFEVISLLSQLDTSTRKESNTPDVFSSKSVLTIRSLLPIMFSMSYLHIANHSMSEDLDQSTEYYFELALKYWPDNPAASALLADYHKQMKIGSDISSLCDLYVKAATYAGMIKGAALGFHDTTEERFNLKEMMDILVIEGALDMSEDDEDQDEEENEEQNIQSCSSVEVKSSFMAAMLLSCLGKHEDALVHLQKFRFSQRIHPNVWKASLEIRDSIERNELTPDIKKVLFLPRIYHGKEGVLPQEHYQHICKLFAPGASYWDESDYNNRGYYSYYFDVKAKSRNVVEDAIIHHLLPLAEQTLQEEHKSAQAIVGAEWWVHTRPQSANLGHPLHFDTDEWLLNTTHEVSHPIVSSVLYLTGGGTGAAAGSTVVFDQAPDANKNGTQAWLSEPKNNHFINFPGNLLHGVLPCIGDSSNGSDSDKNRLTLMVGFWTRDVTASMKNRQLYGPCGPLPPATREHSWVLEAQKNVKQFSCNMVEAKSLKVASPAWETIGYPDEDETTAALTVPLGLDHYYFVSDAPHCFMSRLFS